MKPHTLQAPKMNKERSRNSRYGHCPECGKIIMLRNSDGMIRKHGLDKITRLYCHGSFLAPSKAAESVFVKDWAPPRRTE